MKMEPIVSSETSAIRTQTPGNYPKRNNLHLEHGESLRTKYEYYAEHDDPAVQDSTRSFPEMFPLMAGPLEEVCALRRRLL